MHFLNFYSYILTTSPWQNGIYFTDLSDPNSHERRQFLFVRNGPYAGDSFFCKQKMHFACIYYTLLWTKGHKLSSIYFYANRKGKNVKKESISILMSMINCLSCLSLLDNQIKASVHPCFVDEFVVIVSRLCLVRWTMKRWKHNYNFGFNTLLSSLG